MPDQSHPTSKSQAPDPARSYERAKPEAETGMGNLQDEKAATDQSPDRGHEAVGNRQDPTHQINAQDDAKPAQPDHSMHDEEPDGWDLAPNDIQDPKMKRHPRTEGKGGTP